MASIAAIAVGFTSGVTTNVGGLTTNKRVCCVCVEAITSSSLCKRLPSHHLSTSSNTSFVLRNHGVHGGLYPAAMTSAFFLVFTPSLASASLSSLSFTEITSALMFPLNVCTATVRAGTSFIVTFASVGTGTWDAFANRDAGRKKAIVKDSSPFPLCISTGAVIAMGDATSFLGVVITPMNEANFMNDFPWSPSNIPFFDVNPVSATTQGAYLRIS